MKYFCSFSALIFAGAILARSGEIQSLDLYIVDSKPFPKSQPVSIKRLDLDGFMNQQPDLRLTKLSGAFVNKNTDILHNPDGSVSKTFISYQANFNMFQEDQKRFYKLTQLAAGKRILFQIGNKPLIAPFVKEPIDSPQGHIPGNTADVAKAISDDLSHLVDKKQTEQGAAANP